MRVNTDHGYSIIDPFVFFRDKTLIAKEAAVRVGLRHHRKNGGKGVSVIAQNSSHGKAGHTVWDLTFHSKGVVQGKLRIVVDPIEGEI